MVEMMYSVRVIRPLNEKGALNMGGPKDGAARTLITPKLHLTPFSLKIIIKHIPVLDLAGMVCG
jgi:hypothetical protein